MERALAPVRGLGLVPGPERVLALLSVHNQWLTRHR